MEQFYNYFLRELKRDGYEGIFSPKSRAKTMTDTERKRVDGCAIFYKTSKFTLVKEHLIEFNQLAMSLTQSQPGNGADSNGPTGGGSSGMNVQSNRNLLNRVMPKVSRLKSVNLPMCQARKTGLLFILQSSTIRKK